MNNECSSIILSASPRVESKSKTVRQGLISRSASFGSLQR